jgi:hypothetical protein
MMSDLAKRLCVVDGDGGWEVHRYDRPGYLGAYTVLADGMSEDEADEFVRRVIEGEITERDIERCDSCGITCHIDELDGKPTMTWWLFVIWLLRGDLGMLRYAADHGYDFDRLECRECYGRGYSEI